MNILFGLLLVAGMLGLLAWTFSQMKTPQSRQSLRVVLGLLGIFAGIALTLRGLAVAGIPVLTASLGLLAVALKGATQADAGPSTGAGRPPSRKGLTRKEAADVLGVSENATEDEIRAAYRELMKRVHPDAGGNKALASRVQEARDTLLNT
jgi:DnaJ-domain-containing protein 1